jgi:hypothetical protein
MKLALFYNLNFTKVFINLEKCVIQCLNFVSDLYLNVFGWREA